MNIDNLTSEATSFALEDDRFLYATSGDSIVRVDLETFAAAADQIPALTETGEEGEADLAGDIEGLAIRGSFLFASQSDGDLVFIDLDDVTNADPGVIHISDGELGALVSDPDSDDDQLYILDKAHNAVILLDLSNAENPISIPLTDGLGSPVTPSAIAFASVDGAGDKVFITSERGLVFVLPEGGTSVSTISLAVTNNSLISAAATPDGNFVLVADSTDNVVSVLSTSTETEVDSVSLAENSDLRSIAVAQVDNPEDTYAFVTGSSGLSVIDLEIADASFLGWDILDLGDDDDTPLTITDAGLLVASTDGYLYAAAGDSSISVISEYPFVTIGSTSLSGGSLTTGASFTLTFQSDEAGTYRVVVGGDLTGDGTEVASGNVSTADTDVTTDAIAYDESVFQEGSNRVFVFVTDADGFVGRDAFDVIVDTPPGPVEIVSTGFGDEKIYVTFTRLTATDIASYQVFVDTDATAISGSDLTPAVTVAQASSGDTLEAKITGLVNGVTYYIGVEGVDAAGTAGLRTTTFQDGSSARATPEETVGLAGTTGQGGCALIRDAGAAEKTPQWFSLEFKGGAWIPMNGTTRDFLGTFSPMGKAEFGFLYKSKFGVEIGVGFIGAGGRAVGATSGSASRDHFSFIMIPIENSFTFRADFKEDQLLVPYVKAGPDYVFFRENRQGTVTKGIKYGLHGAVGLQVLLDGIEDLSKTMEDSLGVNDVYFTVEGRYGWINNFGGGGVDLSGLTATGGLLFEF